MPPRLDAPPTVEVHGDTIVVTQPGTDHTASYRRPAGDPWLKATGQRRGPNVFLARAWGAANDKACELGWIV